VEENPMSRSDDDFKKYVCDSLRVLSANQLNIDQRINDHIALTQDVLEIVVMGRSMFKFAGYVGKFLRWVVGIVAGLAVLQQLFGDWVKDLIK
jgi:hypothetical protein